MTTQVAPVVEERWEWHKPPQTLLRFEDKWIWRFRPLAADAYGNIAGWTRFDENLQSWVEVENPDLDKALRSAHKRLLQEAADKRLAQAAKEQLRPLDKIEIAALVANVANVGGKVIRVVVSGESPRAAFTMPPENFDPSLLRKNLQAIGLIYLGSGFTGSEIRTQIFRGVNHELGNAAMAVVSERGAQNCRAGRAAGNEAIRTGKLFDEGV